MDARVDGSSRDAEDVGNLGRGKPHVVGQDERRAVLHGEPDEGSIELVTLRDTGVVVSRVRPVQLDVADLDFKTPPPPHLVGTRANEESMDPRFKPVRIAERPKVSPTPDQRFLDRVLGRVAVAEDPPGDCVQPVVGPRRHEVEGVAVA